MVSQSKGLNSKLYEFESASLESFLEALEEDEPIIEEKYVDLDEFRTLIEMYEMCCGYIPDELYPFQQPESDPEPEIVTPTPKKRGRPKKNTAEKPKKKKKSKKCYCVYVHKLKNKEETIFYIGCGNPKTRPMDGENRNILWKSFCGGKFDYEIIFKDLTLEEAYSIETDLINAHGRLVDGSGLLTNIVGGGDIKQYDKVYKDLTIKAKKIAEAFDLVKNY